MREACVCVRPFHDHGQPPDREGKRGEDGPARLSGHGESGVWRRRAAATPAAVKEENERAGERAGPKNGGGGGFTAFKEKRKRGERTSDG